MMKACIVRIAPSIFYELLQLPAEARIVDIRTDIFQHGDLLIKLVGVGDEVEEGQVLKEKQAYITRLSSGKTSVKWDGIKS